MYLHSKYNNEALKKSKTTEALIIYARITRQNYQ